MNQSKRILNGPKFSGSHQTFIDEAKPLILAAKKDDVITKIIIGRIRSVTTSKRSIKCKEIRAGVEITVRGASAIQTLLFYTKAQDTISHSYTKLYEQCYLKKSS
jgi:hypothetical protein